MITFDWSEWWTPQFLAGVRALEAGSTLDDAQIAGHMTAIAAHVGGPRVRPTFPGVAERTAVAERLLHEALQHTQGVTGLATAPGYVISESTDVEFETTVTATTRVNVNTASAAELDGLAGIGPVLAGRIVAARLAGGAFASPGALAERVQGIGEETLYDLDGALSFTHPLEMANEWGAQDRTLPGCYAMVARQVRHADTADARLAGVLEWVAIVCAENPHPRTRTKTPIEPPRAAPPTPHAAAWTAPVLNTAYYYVIRELIEAASNRIDIAMFHIAYPSDSHPTRDLLDALIAAQGRGVAVRVLVDRDRPSDPYLSTVINEAAKDYLLQGGVTCRSDSADILLHSKFLIVDELVIVGSHNWSAGSYFQFDDWSVALESDELRQALMTRFDGLWAVAA